MIKDLLFDKLEKQFCSHYHLYRKTCVRNHHSFNLVVESFVWFFSPIYWKWPFWKCSKKRWCLETICIDLWLSGTWIWSGSKLYLFHLYVHSARVWLSEIKNRIEKWIQGDCPETENQKPVLAVFWVNSQLLLNKYNSILQPSADYFFFPFLFWWGDWHLKWKSKVAGMWGYGLWQSSSPWKRGSSREWEWNESEIHERSVSSSDGLICLFPPPSGLWFV